MKIWIAAGGTGGHLFPALAVVEEMEGLFPGIETKFAVSRRGLEERVLSGSGRAFSTLWAEGLHRREIARNLLFPVTTIIGFAQSLWGVLKFKPNVAFGTGGFISGPALLAAWLARVPFALVALDAFPGVTIRILAPLARKIYVAHDQARLSLGGREEIEFSGTPVRPVRKIDRAEARRRLGLPHEGPLLFVTGGSQGSRALNRAVADALEDLLEIAGLSILWQTGPDHFEDIRRVVEDLNRGGESAGRERIAVRSFIEKMDTALSATDIVLCRAGASTIAELTGYGVASLLVPLPTSAGGHQDANARAMAETGAARLIQEAELTGERLAGEVSAVTGGNGMLEAMSAAASGLARTGAALKVAEGLVQIARGLPEDDRQVMLSKLGGEGR